MNSRTLTWIEEQKPDLVEWAESYVDQSRLFAATDRTERRPHGRKDPHVKTSQLRNLLNAAQAGSPLAVLLNFLRYQIGRGRQGWAHQPSGKQLETLLRDQLGPRCRDHADTLDAPGDRHELESRMAAQLLGFIVREYTYRCAVEGTRS